MSRSQDAALNPSRILEVVLESVRGDGQTEPSIKNAYEAVALVGHASMVAAQFRLVGLGEEHNIESNTDATILPKEWNAHNSTYSFRYMREESSIEYLLKVNRLGNNAVVMGLAGDDQATSFDVPVNEYIVPSALPFQMQRKTPDSLRNIFVNPNRLEDLLGLFKIHVIQKFTIPSQSKEEDEEDVEEARYQRDRLKQPEGPPQRDPLREEETSQPARPHPFNDPLAAAPRRPGPVPDFAPPGFEDEYEMNRPSQGLAMPYGRGGVPRSGDQDLYPQGLGPYDPLRGTSGPGASGGGGMHPTPDDPMFGGFGRGKSGYDPRAPPGSRYDPVGPWDTPPSGRGSGPSGRGFGPGGFGGGFGGGDII